MCHEQYSSIVIALVPVLLLVRPYYRRNFALLLRHSSPNHMTTILAWNCSSIRHFSSRFPSTAGLSSSAGSLSGPTVLLDTLLMVSSASKIEGDSSRGVHRGHTLNSSTVLGWSVRHFVLGKEPNHFTHRSRMSPMLRIKMPFASLIGHRLSCAPQANRRTRIISAQPRSSRASGIPSYFQGFPEVAVAWIRAQNIGFPRKKRKP